MFVIGLYGIDIDVIYLLILFEHQCHAHCLNMNVICIFKSIHNWGTKKKCLTKKGLQKTTLDFCLSYIIIIVMDCCMLIDKMMSY
jgi:hypothetical protein